MKHFTLCLAIILASFSALLAQPSLNVVGHLPLYTHGDNNGANGGLVANDVSGFVKNGVEYAVVGFFRGTSIISLANPSAPVEVAFIPAFNTTGNDWRDVEIWNGFAYLSQEGEGGGILIIDLANIGTATPPTFRWWVPNVTVNGQTANLTSTHSIWLENGYMYLNGSNTLNGTLIFDVNTTPGTPIFKGATPCGGNPNYVHDSYSRNDTLYTSHIYSGNFKMYDIHDKTNPVQIGTATQTPYNFTHNTWSTHNGTYLFTTDEKADAPIGIYNIHDKANVQQVGTWARYSTLGTGVIGHNVYTLPNNYMVLANYTDGVTLMDVTYPDNVVEIANYDTHPAPITSTPFEGVWAVYPYAPSGALYVADINEGFYVMQPTYQRACWLVGNVTDCSGAPLNGVAVTIKANNVAVAGNTSKTTGVYKTGYALPGTYTVTFTKPGLPTITQTVTLTSGVQTTLNVQMVAANSFTTNGTTKEMGTNANLAGVTVVLSSLGGNVQAVSDANGAFNFSCITAGTYNVLAGKWGYKVVSLPAQNLSAAASNLNLILEKGYEDPFALNFNWTIAGTCTQGQGVWIRTLPDNLVAGNGVRFTPAADDPNDVGDLCFTTGTGGGTTPGADDLDLCATQFTSPNMDLSTFTDPHIKFDYWFQDVVTQGSTFALDDKFWVIANNGTRTDTVFSATAPLAAWHFDQDVRLKNFQNPTATTTITFRIADRGNPHWVKGAVDNFRVYNYVATENTAFLNAKMKAQPNPFNNTTIISYNLEENEQNATLFVYDILGKTVLTKTINQQNGQIEIGNELEQGIYFVRLSANGKFTESQKILKLK